MIKVTCACVISLAIGTGIGWTLHSTNTTAGSAAPAASFAASTLHVQSSPGAAPGVIDAMQLRAMMREELAGVLADEHGDRGSGATPAKETPASPALVAQRREAAEEIQSMVSGGQWGNEQRVAFHQSMALLDPEQAERALRDVTMALVEGRIQVTGDGPPL